MERRIPKFDHRKALLVIILFLTACTVPNVESENWVVFSADKAQSDQMLDWLLPSNAEYWSPTAADVRTLEGGLPAYLQENKSAFYTETLFWEQLDEYSATRRSPMDTRHDETCQVCDVSLISLGS